MSTRGWAGAVAVAAALGLGLAAPAGAVCGSDHPVAGDLAGPAEGGAARSPVAAAPVPDGVRAEYVVRGGPGESVLVVAPADVSVTAIGGDGIAGTPGAPGQPK